jgi:uncharacterized protein DUF6916
MALVAGVSPIFCRRNCMSAKLSIQDFAPYLHASFRVAGMDGYELKLAEVTDSSNKQLEQFSLIFKSPTSPWLQQQSYTLIHPQLSEIEIFLVPLGPDSDGMRYEAVFSRLMK